MLASSMLEFKNSLTENGIVFCYSGYMTEDILHGIGSALKKKLDLEEVDRKVRKAAFAIFVEQVQNIIRYSVETVPQDHDASMRYGILSVGYAGKNIFVSCGNAVDNATAAKLKSVLERIKGLDRDGLKALWKETLKGEPPEGSKGAGIGFIDIARQAKGGLEFDFVRLDADNMFFAIKAYI